MWQIIYTRARIEIAVAYDIRLVEIKYGNKSIRIMKI